ncbi:MAG: hypothetical protein ACO398_07010 [Kiritimatiellia bacterium]
MNDSTSFNNGKIYLPEFSFTEDYGEKFFDTLGLKTGGSGEIFVGAHTVQMELFRLYDKPGNELTEVISRADACLMLTRYFDQTTIHVIKEAYHVLGSETLLPKSIVILREHKEAEFKIGCTYCGQKLWVRDRDAGRRGNCPKCRKTFFIPTQKAYLTSYLMLTENVPVETAIVGEHTCREAVEHLVARLAGIKEGAKSSTMRLELPTDDFHI